MAVCAINVLIVASLLFMWIIQFESTSAGLLKYLDLLEFFVLAFAYV